jgi:hypothetical protein
MGGSDHALIQVQAISKSSSGENAGCPQLPPRFQSISMNFGWIGTTQENLVKILGKPSGKQNGLYKYLYSGKKTHVYDGQKIEFDVTSYIEFMIFNGTISSINASHVTSS